MERSPSATTPGPSTAGGLVDLRPPQSDPIAQRLRANLRRAVAGVDAPPPQIGRFVVQRRLGAGGMGVVYEAHDPTLERTVALKVIAVDASGVERTLGEARMLARLSHPNVVAVHEAGVADGAVFIAMELVAGPTLRQWANESRSPDEIVRAFIAAADGLAAAHDEGITHRDFKPDNVIVSDEGAVVVADFGLARLDAVPIPVAGQPMAEPASRGAVASAIAGTPAYMAPEQRADGEFSPASDQYAFCVSLCELLTGTCPVTPGAASTLRGEAPGVGDADDVLHGLPKWMRSVVARGLQVDPTARWPSMSELAARLRDDPATRRRRRRASAGWITAAAATTFATSFAVIAAADDEPVGAVAEVPCQTGAAEIAETWDAGTADVLAERFEELGGREGAATWGAVRGSLDRYAARWATMRDDSCAATRIRAEQSDRRFDLRQMCLDQRRQELSALLAGFGHADESGTRRALRAVGSLAPIQACAEIEVLEATVPLPASPEARDRLLDVSAQTAEALALRNVAKVSESESVAAAAVAQARELGHQPTLAEALSAHAKALLARRAPEAEAVLHEALDAASRGKHDRAAVVIWLDLLDVVGVQGTRFDEAMGYAASARAAALRLGQPDDIWGAYLANAASLHLGAGKLDKATELAREAAALGERTLASSDASSISRLNLLAGVFRRSGKLEDARDVLQRAVLLAQEHLPPTAGLPITLRINLAAVHLDLGQPQEARDQAARTVETMREATWLPSAHLVQALAVLGMAEARLNNHDAAVEAGTQMLPLLDPGPSNLRIMAVQTIGLAHLAAERHDAAVVSLNNALAMAQEVYGAEHLQVAIQAFNLALAQRGAGDDLAAIAAYERARTVQEGASGPYETTVISSLIGQGELEAKLGRRDAAIANLQRAVTLAESPKVQGADNLLADARAALQRARDGGTP